jgi:hypothetical protein
MKGASRVLCLAIPMFLALYTARPAVAAVITTNTSIPFYDTSLDGQDIVVIGCTLTVDGSHTFSDVLLLDGATLTHTFSADAILQFPVQISGEQQTLVGTTPDTLDNTNVNPGSLVVTDLSGTNFYQAGTDYLVTPGLNDTTQIARLPASTIPDGSTVRVNYTVNPLVLAGMNLTVSNNVVIDSESAIDVGGRGFGGGVGPGAGSFKTGTTPYPYAAGGGGAYGGSGGISSSLAPGGFAYGNFAIATNAGSGGGLGSGAGGNGGGIVQLTVGGALWVDGRIVADGQGATNTGAGGGAGGTISLSAQSFGGAGTISDNGGAGDPFLGGGGGGGRIVINYALSDFTGTVSAHGGAGVQAGGAGTIYTQSTVTNPAVPGTILVDNAGAKGTNTLLGGAPGIYDLTITNGAVAVLNLAVPTLRNLVVGSNSFLTANLNSPLVPIQIVASNATVLAGGGISVDGAGYAYQSGPGAGLASYKSPLNTGTGGGHGGYGGAGAYGASGGSTYDSMTQPDQPGSGGGTIPGGSGGGALEMNVSGVLSLSGSITANGSSGPGGGTAGGSGGALWVTAGTLSGNGLFSANGGAGESGSFGGGGGGGGRIAIYAGTNQFVGSMSAHGGPGFLAGGAGTEYVLVTGSPAAQIVVDNGGLTGTNTPVANLSGRPDVVVTNGAILGLTAFNLQARSIMVGSNSLVITEENIGTATLLVAASGNATVQAGGGIVLDGIATSSLGGGAGRTITVNGLTTGSGGGHGGDGGNSAGGAAGAGTYGLPVNEPYEPGNPGGAGTGISPLNLGGAGGGGLQMNITGTLTLNGVLSANGVGGIGDGSGGGSGGSIWVTAGTVAGNGSIRANGGAGNLPYGGGGGGGRIAVNPAQTNSFSGTYSATGGAGYIGGGAGTVYVSQSGSGQSRVENLLFINNGGLQGTNTPIGTGPEYAVTISGGAIVQPTSASLHYTFSSLTINPGSELTDPFAQDTLSVTVVGNALVQSNAEISVDGDGYAGSLGPGAGSMPVNNNGSGGGYGGAGGASGSGQPGGLTYGSQQKPANPGSGGGVPSGVTFVGLSAGGGALNFTVNGTLTLNGSLTADGNDGELDTGGGSGGSVLLTANRFAGNGLISAEGGNAGDGGGGGGGRIAIYSPTDSFTGTIQVAGGEGANAGQTGTIYQSNTTSGLQGLTPAQETISCAVQGGNLNLSLIGVSGVTYQILCSTNLVDWAPYGAPIQGNDATINIAAPLGSGQMFFRFSAQ